MPTSNVRYGVFGGWFTLGGVRGRVSFLLASKDLEITIQ